MRAFIREDRWSEFKEVMSKYKFGISAYKPKTYYSRVVDEGLMLILNKKTRELQLITPMGSAPFMEVHTNTYQDVYDAGYIEFIEGRFD